MRTYNQQVINTNKAKGDSSSFELSEFNIAIDSRGYECIWLKEVQCPCRSKNDDTYLSTCKNCGGSGHVWVNPTQIRAIITNIDYRAQMEIYGTLEAGMINITVKDDHKLSYMDKFILLDAIGEFQENLYPVMIDGSNKTYTRYDVESIYYLAMFEDSDKPLKILTEGEDYEVEHNIIKLNEKYNSLYDIRLTIRYQHKPVYYVKDVLHYARTSKDTNGNPIKLPVQASAIRGVVLDKENMTGTRLFNNSFNIKMACNKSNKMSDEEKFHRRLKYSKAKDIFLKFSDAQKQELMSHMASLQLPQSTPFSAL